MKSVKKNKEKYMNQWKLFFDPSIRNRLEVGAFSNDTFNFLSCFNFFHHNLIIFSWLIEIKKNIKKLHNVFIQNQIYRNNVISC